MYTPSNFNESRPDRLIRFIDSRGLASLIHSMDDMVEITHAPVFRAVDSFDESVDCLEGERLVTHVSRGNPIVDRIARNPLVTVEYLGDNSYVSGSWTNSNVPIPTWNYMAVHLQGTANVFNERDRLLWVLDRTAAINEPRVNGAWTRDIVDRSAIDDMLPGITGIEITVEHVEATFKLNQNLPAHDQRHIIEGLRRLYDSGAKGVADAMQRNINTCSELCSDSRLE